MKINLEKSKLLGKIQIKEFEPKTAKPGEEVKRKIQLRDLILINTKNLSEIRNSSRGKELSLEICFNLYHGEPKDTARYTKDLDNLLKIVLDVLPEFMDSEHKEHGLGLIESDKDDLIFEVHASKQLVSDKKLEGIDIEISEWKK